MQTMKYTCFAFLQRWPTSRTQKHSFNTDVLTVINLTVLHSLQDHAVCHTNVLESLALCWFTAEDGSHEHFACLLSAWFYHGTSPPNCRSKYQADSDMDTDTNNEKKKRSFLLVIVGTSIHFRSLWHTYRDRSALSFPDTSLSKASPALVNWAAPSSFSLE